jgi:hypothetical protein
LAATVRGREAFGALRLDAFTRAFAALRRVLRRFIVISPLLRMVRSKHAGKKGCGSACPRTGNLPKY